MGRGWRLREGQRAVEGAGGGEWREAVGSLRGVGTVKPAHATNYTNTVATTLEVSRA